MTFDSHSLWRLCLLVAAVPFATRADAADESTVAARVDGQAVYLEDVRREVQRVTTTQKLAPLAEKTLEAETLHQLVDRQLVTSFLEDQKLAVNSDELNLAIRRLKKELDRRETPFGKYLEKMQLSEEGLKRKLFWQMSWKSYLDRYLTDENLQKYFARHPADFDGRRIQVAHLLLKTTPDSATEKMKAAKLLREQIEEDELTFDEAVKKHSESPTAKSRGELGYINRHEPMPEPFSKAAFQLKVGEVSDPVKTAFGVHLIHCQAIEPGRKKWSDVREPLSKAVTKYLFHWIADRERKNAKIEFTGAAPYFDPGPPRRLVDKASPKQDAHD